MLAATVLAAFAVLTGSAPTASATGPGCTAFSGAYALGGVYTDAVVSIPACGPRPGTGTGPAVYAYPGALSTEGYQCVELSERFLYYRYGVTMPISTNGAQIVDHYAARYPSTFSVIGNGTAGQAPVQGDVLSFSNTADYSDFGHTAVVQASNVDGAGNGSITIIEENAGWTANGVRSLTLSGWRVLNDGFTYTKWLHNRATGTGLGYESAFQANTGNLWVHGDLGAGDQGQGMAPATSPAVTVMPSGGYETAFQANTGNLFVYGKAGSYDTQQGMASGTSPAIAASGQGGFEVAFQANTGDLFTFSSVSGAADRQLGMAPGTSPAVAALPGGGFEVAFQANTGDLWVTGDAGTVDTSQGMASGTSPSIAASPTGGYVVAFQANTGNMYKYVSSPAAAVNLQQGMAPGTSPAIAALPGGGYQMAFQANTGNLLVFGDAANGDTGQGMMPGTSPAIAASPSGGFRAAFQANTGSLYYYTTGVGAAGLALGMATDTSPCVASTLGGGCAPGAHRIGNTTAPSVTGLPRVGSVLTAHVGAWSPSGVTTHDQWLLDGASIVGATAGTLLLTPSMLGRHISLAVTATRAGYLSAGATSAVVVVAPPAYVPLSPSRILDTRSGLGAPATPVAAGSRIDLQVTGRGGVPATGATVVLNVTAVGPSRAGNVVVWPAGQTRPTASNLNYVTGQTIANLVVARVGAGGKVSLWTSASTHLLADVSGYFPQLAAYSAITPTRLLDSRIGLGGPKAVIPAGGSVTLSIAGTHGVPTNAAAAALNLTPVGASAKGYVTAYPSGITAPTATSVAYGAGQTRAGLAIVKLGTGGKVTIRSSAATNLVVDLEGWVPASSDTTATTPARLVNAHALAAGTTYQIKVAGLPGVPTNATAVQVTFTSANPAGAGYLTAWPSGAARPGVSNLNYTTGDTVSNSAIVKVGTGGSITVYTLRATTLSVDVSSYWRP